MYIDCRSNLKMYYYSLIQNLKIIKLKSILRKITIKKKFKNKKSLKI